MGTLRRYAMSTASDIENGGHSKITVGLANGHTETYELGPDAEWKMHITEDAISFAHITESGPDGWSVYPLAHICAFVESHG